MGPGESGEWSWYYKLVGRGKREGFDVEPGPRDAHTIHQLREEKRRSWQSIK